MLTPLQTVDLIAREFLARPDVTLVDYSEEEQLTLVAERTRRIMVNTPLWPVCDKKVDIAGFGTADVVLKGKEDEYIVLSPAAATLGMSHQRARAWAEQEIIEAIRDQREMDEENEDGHIGYECLRGCFDLGLSTIVDDPEAKPDADGRRWSLTGEFLISTDRLIPLILESDWREEFWGNARDLMRHAFQDSFGATSLGEFLKPELSKDEAIRQARRGPALGGDAG